MIVGFDNLDLSKITHVVHDLDNFLVDYPDKAYPEKFSHYTGLCAKRTAQELVDEDIATDAQKALAKMCDTTAFRTAVQSYADHGSTTTSFARKYGLDEIKLFRDHHIDLVKHEVKNNFNGRVIPDEQLRQALSRVFDLGIEQNVFTNGTEYYAHAICKDQNLSDIFIHYVGVDSADKSYMTPKPSEQSFIDFLERTKIPSRTGYVVGKTNDIMTERDRDWSNILFGEDSPANLEASKYFNFQTVLKRTARVSLSKDYDRFIDCTMSNTAEFFNRFTAEIRSRKRVITGGLTA